LFQSRDFVSEPRLLRSGCIERLLLLRRDFVSEPRLLRSGCIERLLLLRRDCKDGLLPTGAENSMDFKETAGAAVSSTMKDRRLPHAD
jgi:hypothetical protein